MRVAIHPDDYSTVSGKCDASSARWAELLQNAGHSVKWVNVFRADILEQVHGCDAFMWRWAHHNGMGRIARRLLPVIERELGLLVYPDQKTCWHYDDKIAQAYLLSAAGIPTPRTWIWYDPVEAKAWALDAKYPVVLKLAAGAGSSNVCLVHNVADAHLWIDRLFTRRVVALQENHPQTLKWKTRIRSAARILLKGNLPPFFDNGFEPQSGYILFQEFLPGNQFDTRITVIGHRAFGYRRFNRPNDFRASGSGNFSTEPAAIDEGFVRLAFRTALALQSQSCAIDGLYSERERVIGEISYTYVSWMVYECPGHWALYGSPERGELVWIAGHKWPEEAQIEDFSNRLRCAERLHYNDLAKSF